MDAQDISPNKPDILVRVFIPALSPAVQEAGDRLCHMFKTWGVNQDVFLSATDTVYPDGHTEREMRFRYFADGYDLLMEEVGVHAFQFIPASDPEKRRHTVFVPVFAGLVGTIAEGAHSSSEAVALDEGAGDAPICYYTLEPYKLYQEKRVGFETSDVEQILSGDLDWVHKARQDYQWEHLLNPSSAPHVFARAPRG